jgi:hypothetical protein
MLLDLIRPIESESINGLALQQPISEIGCLPCVIVRHVLPFDLHLLGKDLVADLVAGPAMVRALN